MTATTLKLDKATRDRLRKWKDGKTYDEFFNELCDKHQPKAVLTQQEQIDAISKEILTDLTPNIEAILTEELKKVGL